jgi:prepilin-type processing-associated H-X9-DG protein
MDLNDVFRLNQLPLNEQSGQLNPERRIAAKRHNQGSNWVFLDGHAEYLDSTRVVSNLFREEKNPNAITRITPSGR